MFQLIFQKVISSENTQKFILPSYCTHYFQLGVKVLHLYILYIPFLLKVLSKFYISSTRQQTFHILRSFTYLLSVKFHFPIAMVCVCVCVFLRVCVCVCVCVFVYTLPPQNLLQSAVIHWIYLRVWINNIVLWVLDAFTEFLHLSFLIQHFSPPKIKLQEIHKLEKWYDMQYDIRHSTGKVLMKGYIFDIRCNWVSSQPTYYKRH